MKVCQGVVGVEEEVVGVILGEVGVEVRVRSRMEVEVGVGLVDVVEGVWHQVAVEELHDSKRGECG